MSGVLGGVACWVVLGEWRVGCGVACMLQCMCWVSGVGCTPSTEHAHCYDFHLWYGVSDV